MTPPILLLFFLFPTMSRRDYHRFSVTNLVRVSSDNSFGASDLEDNDDDAASKSASQKKSIDKNNMVVFSGGTAFNTIASELQSGLKNRWVVHVLPVSDDGGSTAEIVRVLGGPAVGDIRSRCLRLSDESTAESRAVKHLLGHRLISSKTAPSSMSREEVRQAARQEWLAIVEGDGDSLWGEISSEYKDTIRAFLVHFHVAVLKHATEKFNFTGGSVGNFFFAGARIFFQSMSAAIFLYSRVSGIPKNSRVLPAVVTEERLTLGALLLDGTRIRGQSNISHPEPKQGMAVNKESGQLGSSPIQRVTYLYHDRNQPHDNWDDKQQVRPKTNPQVLEVLDQAGCIVYGMGSLYTSILPALILEGVTERIVSSDCPKVLLLNGWHDRETSWQLQDGSTCGMDAAMFVMAIVDALEDCYKSSSKYRQNTDKPLITDYVTHILYPAGGEVDVNQESLENVCKSRWSISNNDSPKQHIHTIEVQSISTAESSELNLSGGKSHHRLYEPKALVRILGELTDQLTGVEGLEI